MKNLSKKPQVISGQVFTQFELTQNLLNNLQQFNITPTAKLVLLYLSSCYNPKKAGMFPKQKTIAAKIGVSEVSVNRAICELHSEGFIISERKYTLLYKFTPKFLNLCGFVKDLIEDNQQKDNQEINKLITPYKEQTIEHIKEPIELGDYKILVSYAKEHKAKNINGYINALKRSGSAEQIIKEHKAIANRYNTGEVERIKKIKAEKIEQLPPEYFAKIREKLQRLSR